jgi:LytS/YehU family sensor histidine kinase
VVHRLTERWPWPQPFRLGFLVLHLVAAAVYSVAWLLLNSLITSLFHRQFVLVVGPGIGAFLVSGVWLYVMVAGVSYATHATARAARSEALAAQSQLAALRAQLHPHFLFNALHTVVQLIPIEPRRAVRATEEIAALLRATIDEDRDLVALAEERGFAERYLDLERLRFGDRLRVEFDFDEEAESALVPTFTLLTLVENAVRHGLGPRAEPTRITIIARRDDDRLILTVRDDGAGTVTGGGTRGGTGLHRLRDRLAALYQGRGRLDAAGGADGGFVATVTLPQDVEAP